MICNRDGRQVPVEAMLSSVLAGPALTIELDGEPIGCGGIILMWPGVGHGWMKLSQEMAPHMRWCFRVVRQFVRDVRRDFRLHRLEAEVLDGYEENRRWAEALGFTQEVNGRAQALLPDHRTMIRYELVTHG